MLRPARTIPELARACALFCLWRQKCDGNPPAFRQADILPQPAGSLTRNCPTRPRRRSATWRTRSALAASPPRSEEHTSELQSRENLVCRLLLEKKKTNLGSGGRQTTTG